MVTRVILASPPPPMAGLRANSSSQLILDKPTDRGLKALSPAEALERVTQQRTSWLLNGSCSRPQYLLPEGRTALALVPAT